MPRKATGIAIKITSRNAAIVDGGRAGIADLVQEIADKARSRDYGAVYDVNGNQVGDWQLLWTDCAELGDDETDSEGDE